MNLKKSTLAVAVLVACNMGVAVSSSGNGNVDSKAGSAAVSRALGHVQNMMAKSAGTSKQAESFVARDVIIDADGAEHVRFDRMSKGLRIIGGDMVIHSATDGSFADVSHSGASAKRSSTGVTLSPTPDTQVSSYAEGLALDQASALFQGAFSAEPTASKVFYARDREPTLAFDVLVKGVARDGTPTEMHYIIDANSNAVLDSFDDVRSLVSRDAGFNYPMFNDGLEANEKAFRDQQGAGRVRDAFVSNNATGLVGSFETITPGVASLAKAAASGTGNSLLAGSVSLTTDSITGGFALRDPSRGSHYATNMSNRTTGNGTTFTDTNNVWGNGATTDAATAAVDAVYGQNKTWDYYKTVLGRNGIANDGRGAFSRIHYGSNYVNAFWSDQCFCMTYGDGNGSSFLPLIALDIAGHEMTHGVTSRSANLTYSGESGGLNEAISDMVGTAVEFYANNATSPANYLIGERIYASNKGVATPTKALRYMFKPSIDGKSPDCYTSTLGTLDVHYSSGVANHFFYLLSEGAVNPAGFNYSASQLVCNGNTSLTAIGRTAAMKIVYRALTVYMTASTNYKGARVATLKAATDLYGANSTQYNATAAAWSAVSVN
jgi:zinc metalloprotease ZmpA